MDTTFGKPSLEARVTRLEDALSHLIEADPRLVAGPDDDHLRTVLAFREAIRAERSPAPMVPGEGALE